jgi:AraC-like DNA-binding protein
MEPRSRLTMGDIAQSSGFNSRTSFNRHCKELTGFTPTV